MTEPMVDAATLQFVVLDALPLPLFDNRRERDAQPGVPVTTMSAAQEPSSFLRRRHLAGRMNGSWSAERGDQVAHGRRVHADVRTAAGAIETTRDRRTGDVAASATCSVIHVSALPAMGSPSKKMATLSGGEATSSGAAAVLASAPSTTVVTLWPSAVASLVDSADMVARWCTGSGCCTAPKILAASEASPASALAPKIRRTPVVDGVRMAAFLLTFFFFFF